MKGDAEAAPVVASCKTRAPLRRGLARLPATCPACHEYPTHSHSNEREFAIALWLRSGWVSIPCRNPTLCRAPSQRPRTSVDRSLESADCGSRTPVLPPGIRSRYGFWSPVLGIRSSTERWLSRSLRRAGPASRRSYSGTEPTRSCTWPACGHCKRASALGGGGAGASLEVPADPPHRSVRRRSKDSTAAAARNWQRSPPAPGRTGAAMGSCCCKTAWGLASTRRATQRTLEQEFNQT